MYWRGFKIETQLDILAGYGLASFSYVGILTEKDISTMASGFATRTKVNDRFQFDIRMTKYLKSLVHWVQDFYHTLEKTKIKGLNQIVFMSHLERALASNELHISMKANTSTVDKESSTGPLKSERG